MSNIDIDFSLNLKSSLITALNEYLEYQRIIVNNKGNVSLTLAAPGVGTVGQANIPFSNRGRSGYEEAQYQLRMISNLGDDPVILIECARDLLLNTRKSRSSKDRYSRYGCLVYHIVLAYFSSMEFYKENKNIFFQGIFNDLNNTVKKTFVEGKIKVTDQMQRLESNIGYKISAYLSGARLSYFSNKETKYINFHKFGDAIVSYFKNLLDNSDIVMRGYDYRYKYNNTSTESMKNFFESQIKAVQIKDPLAFSIIYLLTQNLVRDGKYDKTSLQMIRKILHIPKDFLHTNEWVTILLKVHWLSPKNAKQDQIGLKQIEDQHIVRSRLSDSNHFHIKELDNDLFDSLLDIHDGLAGVLLSASTNYIEAMGHQTLLTLSTDNSVKWATGLPQFKKNDDVNKVGLISKYSFGTLDIGISPLSSQRNSVFGKHGVSGLEKALEIKSFAEQAIQLRSRFLESEREPLTNLCHYRVQHMINCFYQISYSLLDSTCTPLIWWDWVLVDKKSQGNMKVRRSSLITFIILSYLKFFEKEQSTLQNAQFLLADSYKKNSKLMYKIPRLDYEDVKKYMAKLSSQHTGKNIHNALLFNKGNSTDERTKSCWEVLNKSLSDNTGSIIINNYNQSQRNKTKAEEQARKAKEDERLQQNKVQLIETDNIFEHHAIGSSFD